MTPARSAARSSGVNEHYFLGLARRCGLAAAASEALFDDLDAGALELNPNARRTLTRQLKRRRADLS